FGIEPSDIMIEKARNNNFNIRFIQASAEKIPLPDTYVHGAIATLTLHHWENLQKGINEIYRILKKGCNFVILSFTPEQMLSYWLHHYFPKMIESSMKTIPAYKTMESMLQIAGFKTVSTEKYFVQKIYKIIFFTLINSNRNNTYCRK